MLLAVDVGNTNIKLGLFDGERIAGRWRILTDRQRLADEYAVLLRGLFAADGFSPADVTGMAVASVVPALTEMFRELGQRHLGLDPLIMGPGARTGLTVTTENPAEVGVDLIANAIGAQHLYGAPLVVIGFGTATTFVAVTAAGELAGVAIAPGVSASGESLFRATATLPQVALARPAAAIGRNTVESLRAGFVFGFAGLVEHVAARIRAELGGSARVVATGGLAGLIAPEAPIIEAVEPDLALIGLRLVYDMNQPGANSGV